MLECSALCTTMSIRYRIDATGDQSRDNWLSLLRGLVVAVDAEKTRQFSQLAQVAIPVGYPHQPICRPEDLPVLVWLQPKAKQEPQEQPQQPPAAWPSPWWWSSSSGHWWA